MKKFICLLILVFFLGCGPQLNKEMLQINTEWIATLKTFRTMAQDEREILAFEIAGFKNILGKRAELLPHDSYEKLNEVARIADKIKTNELTQSELAIIATWKLAVLTPIAIEVLKQIAPDVILWLATSLGLLL